MSLPTKEEWEALGFLVHPDLCSKPPTHTQGSWRVVRIGSESYIEADGLICDMQRNLCPNESAIQRCDADARLISAAPDLLATLKEIADSVGFIGNNVTPAMIERVARAAIAKAEGKV